MLSVLVTNSKGGCGKTTVATQLAAAFAVGGLRSALADVDRQRSSLHWIKNRPLDAAPIAGVDWNDGQDKPPYGTARLVIDAPAGLRMKKLKELVRVADVIVVPVLPSAFDTDAAAEFLRRLDTFKPIRKNKRAVAVLRNRVRVRSRAGARLDHFIQGVEHVDVGTVPDRAVYDEVAMQGLSIFDVGGVAARALRQDWMPLLRFIEAAAINPISR